MAVTEAVTLALPSSLISADKKKKQSLTLISASKRGCEVTLINMQIRNTAFYPF